MPTGSGKTPLCGFLTNLLDKVRTCAEIDEDTPWMVDDASMEKMGAMMANNESRLLGLYDELSTFLTQINVYRGGGSVIPTTHLPFFLCTMDSHGTGTQVCY